MNEFQTIQIEREGGIARIALDRPDKRNALSPLMARELTDALRSLEADHATRVVTLRGVGGHFCSGGDLTPEPDQLQPEAAPRSPGAGSVDLMNRIYGETIRTLHRFPKPVVALVEGVAAGAGANLAFACDLVYASDEARFAEIFVKRGLGLDCGGSWLLPRLIGLQRAKELAFFGDWISSEEARRIGLMTQVYEASAMTTATDERVATLATRAPIALTQIKQSLHRATELGLSETLEIESVTQAFCASTDDAAEGFRAFAEKRDPRFTGS